MHSWTHFLKLLAATFAGLLAIAATLIWIANPYGNLRFSPLAHVLMDDNQRFQYPAVIRSQRYDSLVIGTSTARLLQPAELQRVLGGRFANLALNSGTAWEQWRVARLFAREVAAPRTLLIGLDHVWCAADADTHRITRRGFPEWMFDDNPWNDLAFMLNARTVEISVRRLWHALGRTPERWPHNGYEVFVPPESAYNLARARQHIYGLPTPPRQITRRLVTRSIKQAPVTEARDAREFPALTWLEDLVASRGFKQIVLVTMPVHIAAQARSATPEAARETRCRMAMAEIAGRHGLAPIDFRKPSPITRADRNYWDPLHYRVPIATRIVQGIGRAVATGKSDPDGDWRSLNGKR